ncbi:amidohydrolase family protein [Alteromonadaceae bacterium M269]|nr:amidohydrolase family protein [Alteromonadaceae bacterium M269]
MKIIKTLIATSLFLSAQAAFADTYIHAGKMIPADSDKVFKKMTIVIDGNKIKSIEKGYKKPGQGDELIDLSDSTVLPGLIDMHTHITSQYGPRANVERFTLNAADYALNGVKYAELTLQAGFTTIRNLNDEYNSSVALRNAINRGVVDGPRIFTAAKALSSTGGHIDPTNGFNSELMGNPGPKEGVVNSADDARQAIRQRYKDGADLIKIASTGGVLSVAKSGQNPQFTDEELDAIVATAKDYGFKVAVHAHGKLGMERAIKAGVDSIEHGTYMDDETFELMKKHGTYYVPTVLAGKWVAEKAEIDGFFPDLVRPKAAAIGPLIQNTLSRAYNAGVKIAFGTDSGVSAHGDNGKEFVYMAEAGMKPIDVIRSATYHAAELLGESDTLGTIEAGKFADFIAVKGDPTDDINHIRSIHFVMKDGKVYKQQL